MLYSLLKNILLLLIILSIAPTLIESISKQYNALLTPKTKVGVINLCELGENSQNYYKSVYAFFANPEIKAILLKIECPGGAAGTSQALFNEIRSLKKEFPKPVVALVENVCASGGYYIACAADHIIAPGTAIIGSIGTCIPYLFQLNECIEQYKIHYIPMKAGAYKSVGDPFTQMTEEDKALLQAVVDDSYNQFVRDVAQARNLSIGSSYKWAEGKVFSGQQAKDLGLIDAVGSAYNAQQVIREKGLIEGEIEWVKPQKPFNLMNALTGDEPQHEGGTMFNRFVGFLSAMQKTNNAHACHTVEMQ